MENINIVLAANILKYRKKSGLSQEELANKLGVTFQAVSKWELAKSAPDISFLPTMADVFECSLDELCGRKHKTESEGEHGRDSNIQPSS
jgi:transcriptional regulator with XRE-family HTH domain